MATQWAEVYNEICTILLEPLGLTLGLLTDQQFYTLAGEVLLDFCSTTGLNKKIFDQTLNFGVGEYEYSSMVGDIENVVAEGNYLSETSDYFLSNTNSTWATDIGPPEVYREDNINPQAIQIYPTPPYEGTQFFVAAGQGGYGVLSSTVDGTVSLTASNAGYGTIGSTGGAIYTDTENPGYGVTSSWSTSEDNLEVFASAIPFNITSVASNTYIELVPDDFVPYLKYGILSKIFSSDSELKSESKAKYCQTRYLEGISMLQFLLARYDAE